MMTCDLTLAMITKNEEKNIERCLKSVQGTVNEIVIVDTGSTDRTIEIAKDYDANIFQHDITPWNFAKARNWSLYHSIGRYILQLDADEELDNSMIGFILENIMNEDKKIGLECVIENILPGKQHQKFYSIRFFKNDPKVRYCRIVHEQIYPSLVKLGYDFGRDERVKIIHHGYNCSPQRLRAKANRNLALLLELWQREKNWSTTMQLAQTYALLDDIESTKIYYELALKFDTLPEEYRIEMSKTLLELETIFL